MGTVTVEECVSEFEGPPNLDPVELRVLPSCRQSDGVAASSARKRVLSRTRTASAFATSGRVKPLQQLCEGLDLDVLTPLQLKIVNRAFALFDRSGTGAISQK